MGLVIQNLSGLILAHWWKVSYSDDSGGKSLKSGEKENLTILD